MDLHEIGDLLRQSREKKGLTLDDVEHKVKISRAMLVALEEADKERFPHPVYARGFLRGYARLLDLDVEELCAEFSREYPVPQDDSTPLRETGPILRSRHRKKASFSGQIAFILLLGLILSASGWYAYGKFFAAPSVVPEVLETPELPAPVEPSVANVGSQGENTQNAQGKTEDFSAGESAWQDRNTSSIIEPQAALLEKEAQQVDAVDIEPLTPQKEIFALQNLPSEENNTSERSETNATLTATRNATSENSMGAGAVAKDSDSEKPVVVSGKTHTFYIEATHANSWLQARPDGKVSNYFLRKGESTTVSFSEKLSIKFGNAGGVSLKLDGQAYPMKGTHMGEVRTLVVR